MEKFFLQLKNNILTNFLSVFLAFDANVFLADELFSSLATLWGIRIKYFLYRHCFAFDISTACFSWEIL